jgi:hypothetical protein
MYTLAELTTHCETTVHSQEEQYKRALNQGAVNNKLACRVCGEEMQSSAKQPTTLEVEEQLKTPASSPPASPRDLSSSEGRALELDPPAPSPHAPRRDSSSLEGGALEYRFSGEKERAAKERAAAGQAPFRQLDPSAPSIPATRRSSSSSEGEAMQYRYVGGRERAAKAKAVTEQAAGEKAAADTTLE